jgi:hypothetical protein
MSISSFPRRRGARQKAVIPAEVRNPEQKPVIPAEAGTQSSRIGLAARGEFREPWVPACAGMTRRARG